MFTRTLKKERLSGQLLQAERSMELKGIRARGRGSLLMLRRTKSFFPLFFLLIAVAILAMAPSVSAQSDMPVGLQKIIDYNNQSTADFALKISFLIAFVAGILGILSPCILPFLPAYFSYTFKEKRNITKMTAVFFLGFSLVFMAMGVAAGLIGSQVLSVIQSGWLVTLAGIFIIFLGVMSLLGKGFSSFFKHKRKLRNDLPGIFLFGMFFAVGWTACLGPILAGILGIGAVLGNVFHSTLLLFFYSLGNLVPVFVLSVFYDKLNLSKSKFIKGKIFQFSIGNKEFQVHSTNLISGILFIIVGATMVIYRGTSVINKWDIFGTKQYFYSLQRQLISWDYANLLGIILLVLFTAVIGGFLWKHRVNDKANDKANDTGSNKTKKISGRFDRYSFFCDLFEYLPEKLLYGKWRRRFVSKLKGKILEVGVGTGKNLQYYSKEAKVTGIDFSPGMLNGAIKESNRIKLNCSLLQMDAQDLKFEDSSFNNVFCTFVLCSVPDPVKALKEMRRVCKQGGRIVMIEHVLSKNKVIAFLQHLHNPFWRLLSGVNINRDTLGNIKNAGLKIVEERNLMSNDIFKLIVCVPDK